MNYPLISEYVEAIKAAEDNFVQLKHLRPVLDEDYFEHLLAEIREIRLSERRFYQKLTDIYATAIDYNRDAPTTKMFFKMMQNKMHYAVHGHTAAELIVECRCRAGAHGTYNLGECA